MKSAETKAKRNRDNFWNTVSIPYEDRELALWMKNYIRIHLGNQYFKRHSLRCAGVPSACNGDDGGIALPAILQSVGGITADGSMW